MSHRGTADRSTTLLRLLVMMGIMVLAPGMSAIASAEAPSAPAGWPQYGYAPTHQFDNPNEHLLDAGNVGSLAVAWEHEFGAGSFGVNQFSAAPLYGGRLYTSDQYTQFFAIDARTGDVAWSYYLGGLGTAASVAYGLVYVGANPGGVLAFPASCTDTCSPVWTSPVGGGATNSPPAVADGVVYVGGYDGFVYALDARRGSLLWRGSVNLSLDPLNVSPTVDDGMVYVAGDRGVWAFPAACSNPCHPVWRFHTAYAVERTVSVSGGIVFALADPGTLYGLDAATGAMLWSAVVPQQPYGTAVADGMVYEASGDTDGTFSAFVADGCGLEQCDPVWTATVGPLRGLFPPVVANGVVYVGSIKDWHFFPQNIYAFPTSCVSPCQPLWTFTVNGAVEAPMTVAGGHVYALTSVGNVYQFALPSRGPSGA